MILIPQVILDIFVKLILVGSVEVGFLGDSLYDLLDLGALVGPFIILFKFAALRCLEEVFRKMLNSRVIRIGMQDPFVLAKI
jgi:hypothetical protein